MECLQREQEKIRNNEFAEETAILRQELAYGAFQKIRAKRKQEAVFRQICEDKSPLLHRLAIYLLQQPECLVTWADLNVYHLNMSRFSELVKAVDISTDAPKLCFIAQTLKTTYKVTLQHNDLRNFYGNEYDAAVEHLRMSESAYHSTPNEYIRMFHQFAHITLIAFYQYVLPSESGLYERDYSGLTNQKTFSEKVPRGLDTWKRLGSLRNRVDHPIDRKTKTHSKKITVKEAEDTLKELQVALQELFDVWTNNP